MDPLDDIYREIRDIRRRLRDLEALDRRDVPESSLAPHNHTAVEGDGGPLTNDEHDGYSEYAAIASPDTPAAGKIRAYGVDDNGILKMAYKRPDGTQILLAEAASGAPSDAAYLVEAAHAGLSNETPLDTAIARSTWATRGAAAVAGRLQLYTDAPYLGRDNGASIDLHGPIWPLTPPTLADFTWVNQGTATASEEGGLLYLHAPAASGANLRILEQALPDPPWTCVAYLLPELHGQNFAKCGLVLGNSGNNFRVTFGCGWSTSARIQIQSYNSPGAYVSNYLDAPMMFPYPMWWRIVDDGVNRHYATSVSGRHWKNHLTHSRTTQVTANTIGFFAESNNGTWPAGVLLVSWEVLAE